MSTLSILVFLSLAISSTKPFNHYRFSDDDMCEIKAGILCLRDQLLIIKTVAEGIIRRTNEIEKNIYHAKAFQTLKQKVNEEMNFTSRYAPRSYYHQEFFRQSNIDKTFLSELFLEGHHAMVYYYNSIETLLKDEDIFAHKTDEWFRRIQNSIKGDIICRYRSALHMFAYKWQTTSEVGEVFFSKQHRLSPSVLHDLHSVVIAKYLKEWMERMTKVIDEIPAKFI